MRAFDVPDGRWLLVAARSRAIGSGHAARLSLLAATARKLGMDADLVVLGDTLPRAGGVNEADATTSLIAERRSAPAVLVLDGPDEFIEAICTGWSPRTLKVAFRMYGVARDVVPAEDVTVTPSFEPSYEREVRDPRPHLQLGGVATILVRPTCFERPGEREEAPTSILVSMGGSDPAGVTAIACRALLEVRDLPHVTVVVGALNGDRGELRASFGEQFEVVDQRDVDFDRALRRASIAVVNGGLTRYECVAAATPFVAVSLNRDQARLTERVVAHGVGRHVGLVDPGVGGRIRDEVAALLSSPLRRHEMTARARNLLDANAPAGLLARIAARALEG